MSAGGKLVHHLIVAFVAVAVLPSAVVVAVLYGSELSRARTEAGERAGRVAEVLRQRWEGRNAAVSDALEAAAGDGDLLRDAWRWRAGDGAVEPRVEDRLRSLAGENGLDLLFLLRAGEVVAMASPEARGGILPARARVASALAGGSTSGAVPGPGTGTGFFLVRVRPLDLPGPGEEFELGGGVRITEGEVVPLARAADVRVRAFDTAPPSGPPAGALLDAFPEMQQVATRPRRGAGEIGRSFTLGDASSGGGVRLLLDAGTARGVERAGDILVAGLLALAVGGVMAALLASRLARGVSEPVAELAEAAELVAAGTLDRRVPVRRRDEIGDLVQSFNRMTERLGEYRRRERRMERITAWNEVARRLAHELRNPLTPIRIVVEDLERSWRLRDENWDRILAEGVQTVQGEIRSLERLLEEFTLFARLPRPRGAPVDIAELAGEVAALYADPREDVTLVRETSGDARIVADAELLRQALGNVVKNALEAMPAGGTLTVRAERRGDRLRLEVADTGTGMSNEDLARAGEPYFTRKPSGTGLGLALVERILLEHGGDLVIESQVGVGTKVTLVLPVGGPPSAAGDGEGRHGA